MTDPLNNLPGALPPEGMRPEEGAPVEPVAPLASAPRPRIKSRVQPAAIAPEASLTRALCDRVARVQELGVAPLSLGSSSRIEQIAAGLFKGGYAEPLLERLRAAIDHDLACLGASELATQNEMTLTAIRDLAAVLRQLRAEPLALVPLVPLLEVAPEEEARVEWGTPAKALGTLLINRPGFNGACLDVVRTADGELLAGRLTGEVFEALDERGAPAGAYRQVENGLWSQVASEGSPPSREKRDARALIARGLAALDRGALTAAARNFDQALALVPDDREAQLGRARLAILRGRPAAALDDVAAVRAAHPADAAASYLEGLALSSSKPQNAKAAFERAARLLEPGLSGPIFDEPLFQSPEDALLAAEIDLANGEPAQAVQRLEALAQENPCSVKVRLLLGRALLGAGDAEGALREASAAVEVDANNASAWVLRAEANDALGKTVDAASAFSRAAELSFDQGEAAIAEGLYSEALKRDPANPAALTGAGFALDRTGRAGEAAARFSQAGSVYLKASRFHDALRSFDYALERKRNDAGAETGRAQSLLALGEVGAATKSFERALSLDPHNLDALLGKGEAALRAWDFSTAATVFDAVLERAPTHVPALVASAELAARDGVWSIAEIHFASALAIEPDNPRALLGKAECDLRAGRAIDALSGFDKVLAREPDNALAQSGRATALVRVEPSADNAQRFVDAAFDLLSKARPAEALVLFERVSALAPQTSAFLVGKGRALSALGRFDEALACLRQAAENQADAPTLVAAGQAALGAGDFESALDFFDGANLAGVPETSLRLDRGRALLGQRRFEDALAAFTLAAIDDEHNAAAFIGKGYAQLGLSENDAAHRSFSLALGLAPGNAEALRGRSEAATLLAKQRTGPRDEG